MRPLTTPCAAILALASAAAADSGTVSFFPGLGFRDLSPDGQFAVGGTSTNAFRWSAQTGVQILGPGAATEVSGDGSVVVGTSGGNIFRWTAAGGYVPMGSGTTPVVSRDGSTIAYTSAFRTYRWTAATGPVEVTLPGWRLSTTSALSADGSVLAGVMDTVPAPAPQSQAYRWTQATGAVGLGWLPSAGAHHDSGANCMTPDGNTLFGLAAYGPATLAIDSYRWTPAGGMQRLFDGSHFVSFSGCSDAGDIAVGTGFIGAFCWREGGPVRDLVELLYTDFGVDLGVTNIPFVYGLSADGRIIAGFDSGVGWIVTLDSPVPAPGAAIALLILAIPRRRAGRHPRVACPLL